MDKKQLLNLVDSLNLPKSDYYILSSGVLVLYGLREKAGDLDLCVSSKLFEVLKEKYNLTDATKNSCGFYSIAENIEIVVNDNFNSTFKDGYPVEKLENILMFKLKRNAPKDQMDILKLKEYLATNK